MSIELHPRLIIVHVLGRDEGRGGDGLALPRVGVLLRRVGRVHVLVVVVRLRAGDAEVGRARVEAVDSQQVGNLGFIIQCSSCDFTAEILFTWPKRAFRMPGHYQAKKG